MNDTLKVIDHPGLVRDKKSKAILNIDHRSLSAYKTKRDYEQKLKKVADEFDGVKDDLNEIKTLLQQLLKKQ